MKQMDRSDYIELTKEWIKRMVIGLQLCPFAKQPFEKGSIRYFMEESDRPEILMQTVLSELQIISNAKPDDIETTLIIHPNVLKDFIDYLDFVEEVNQHLDSSGLRGIIQVASFHPDYQFAGTKHNDPENYTNRSPFPMLHLIRESSIENALKHYPNPEDIPNQNIQTMQGLGIKGIRKILKQIQ